MNIRFQGLTIAPNVSQHLQPGTVGALFSATQSPAQFQPIIEALAHQGIHFTIEAMTADEFERSDASKSFYRMAAYWGPSDVYTVIRTQDSDQQDIALPHVGGTVHNPIALLGLALGAAVNLRYKAMQEALGTFWKR